MTKKIIRMLDPDEVDLIEDKNHPLYDPRVEFPIHEGLVRSMLRLGFVEDEEVVARQVDGYDKPVVIKGKQRTRAAREANRRIREKDASLAEVFSDEPGRVETLRPLKLRVSFRPEDETFAESYLLDMVSNEHRQDDPPFVQAQKMRHYANLLNEQGRSDAQAIKEVAIHWGCTDDTVRNRWKLLKAPKEMQEAVKQGTATASDVVRIMDTAKTKEERLALFDKTPKKDPKDAGKRRKGKRGGNVKPTTRQVQKWLEVLGEGSKWAPVLRAVLGIKPPKGEKSWVETAGLADL